MKNKKHKIEVYMRRIKFTLLCFIIVISCVSCKVVTDKTSSEDKTTAPDEFVNYVNYSSGDVFLYGEKMSINGLTIRNIETNDEYILCNVPGCLHQADADKECFLNRFVLVHNFSIAYEDKVVFAAKDMNDEHYEEALYLVNMDGKNLKKIVSWEEYDGIFAGRKAVLEGHLFFVAELEKNSISDEGYIEVEESILRLYDVDIENGTIETLYESSAAYDNNIVSGLLYDEDKLCFQYTIQTKSFDDMGITQQEFYEKYDEYFNQRYELQGLKMITIIYDIRTKDYTTIEESQEEKVLPVEGFIDNKIIARDKDCKMIWFDVKTKEMMNDDKAIISKNIYVSANFILFNEETTSGADELQKYGIIQKSGGELKRKTFEPTEYNFRILNESPKYLQIEWYIGDEMLGNYKKGSMEYITREEFLSWFS